ncbi:MAG: hypothetical protein AAF335_03335 [Bacteroidota bacterium]
MTTKKEIARLHHLFPEKLNEMRFSPADYELAFLSGHVYKSKEALEKEKAQEDGSPPTLTQKVNGKEEILAGWEIQEIFTHDDYSSYQSVLYLNKNKNQLVLAYQGTSSLKDWGGTNIPAIVGNDPATGQQKIIEEALEASISLANNADYTLSLTGHSLGGWLAQVASFIAYDQYLEGIEYPKRMLKTVVFDAPGAQEILEKLNHNVIKVKLDLLDITNYVSTPNIVNTFNRHRYTTLYQVVNKKFSKIPFKYDLESHHIDNFIAVFDKDRGGFKEEKVEKIREMKSWPSQKEDKVRWMFDKLFKKQLSEEECKTYYTRYVRKYAIAEKGDPKYRIHKRHIPPHDYDFLWGKKYEKEPYINALGKTKWAKYLTIDRENKDYVILTNQEKDIRLVLDELHGLAICYPELGKATKESSTTDALQKLNFDMAPAKEHLFVGRTKQLETFATCFNEANEADKNKLVIFPPIIGFGGLGKTQLVHKLIEQHEANYDYIVWIDATTEGSFP